MATFRILFPGTLYSQEMFKVIYDDHDGDDDNDDVQVSPEPNLQEEASGLV